MALLALLAGAPHAAAHDTWLVPSATRVPAQTPLTLALVTGERFPVSEHATDPARVAEWIAVRGDARRDLPLRLFEGMALATRDQPTDAGIHVHAVRLQPRYIELAPDDFESYLAGEEAAEALEAWRAAGRPVGHELYTKAGKTFVAVGATNETGFTDPVGHDLEIIPLVNPCRLRTGSALRVRVLLEGEPASGLRVSAGHEGLGPHSYVAHARTDDRGMASFELDAPGMWFLRTHVIRPFEESDPPADRDAAAWESLWASITMRVAAEPEAVAILDPVRDVHGSTDPFAVAGYMIGARALEALELPRDAWQLEVVHHGPLEGRPFALIDGLQAATAASFGRGTLRAEAAPLELMRTVLRDTSSGATCTVRLDPAFLERAGATAPHHFGRAGYATARMATATLMTLELASSGTPEEDEGALRSGSP